MYDLGVGYCPTRLRTSGTSFNCYGDSPTTLPTWVRIFMPEDPLRATMNGKPPFGKSTNRIELGIDWAVSLD